MAFRFLKGQNMNKSLAAVVFGFGIVIASGVPAFAGGGCGSGAQSARVTSTEVAQIEQAGRSLPGPSRPESSSK